MIESIAFTNAVRRKAENMLSMQCIHHGYRDTRHMYNHLSVSFTYICISRITLFMYMYFC